MPYVEMNGERLFYTVSRGAKDSPALILVHGAGGSRLHWPGELRRLPGATVYTLDLPGHGRSEGQGRDTIAGYAEAVVEFLDTLGVVPPS
jgi:pimeloyl-ACP methyl ester carboxylesterase